MDDRGRIKISKELAEPGASVVLIEAGTYFLGIPIHGDQVTASGSWMKSKESSAKLKIITDRMASADAVSRAKRRKQI